MNFTHYTLGEALSSRNETIKRNALSILKQLQKERDAQTKKPFTQIIDEWKDHDPDTGINV